MEKSVQGDFIKKINNFTSDEEFTQKVDKILEPSFIIPKEWYIIKCINDEEVVDYV